MLKSMIAKKNFQTWLLTGWQQANQSEAMLENPCELTQIFLSFYIL